MTIPGPLVQGGSGDDSRGGGTLTVGGVESVARFGEDLLHGTGPHRVPLGGGHLAPGHHLDHLDQLGSHIRHYGHTVSQPQSLNDSRLYYK